MTTYNKKSTNLFSFFNTSVVWQTLKNDENGSLKRKNKYSLKHFQLCLNHPNL